MKTSPISKFRLFNIAILACLALPVAAADRWWDGGAVNIATNGDASSFGGSGLWDTTVQNWDQGPGLAHATWNNANNDTAILAGTAATVNLGAGITVGGLVFNSGTYILTNANTLTFAGTTPTVTANATATIGNNTATVLAGSAGLTKAGTGTLTLNGSAVNTFTGGLTVNLGTLALNLANLAAPTDLINSGNNLIMAGGTLALTGKNSTNSSQTLGNLTINSGSSTIRNVGGATGTNNLTLGNTWTRNPGGILNITNGTGTTVGTVTSSPTLTNDIVGTWATYGTGLATKYATVSSGLIAGLTGTLSATGAEMIDATGTTNYDLAGVTVFLGLIPDNLAANTIRYTGSAVSMTPGSTLFSVNSLMNSGSGIWVVTNNSLTIGADRELVVYPGNSGMAITSVIKDNPAGASGLTISTPTASTPVTMTLSTTNTFTGPTTINGSSLLGNGNSTILISALKNSGVNSEFGAGANIVLNGAIIRNATITGSATTDRNILINGNSGFLVKGSLNQTNTGTISGGGNLSVNCDFASSGKLVLAGSNTFSGDLLFQTDGRVLLNSVYGLSMANINIDKSVARMAMDLTTANLSYIIGGLKGNTNLNLGTGLGGGGNGFVSIGNNGQDNTFGGILYGRGLNKIGAGTLTLTTNLNTTNVTVSAGTLAFSGGAACSVVSNIVINAAGTLSVVGRVDGTLSLASGQSLSGFGTIAGNLAINDGTSFSPGSSVGTLTNAGNVTWNSGGVYKWEINSTNNNGQDLLAVTGALTNQATSGNKFKINVLSLNGSGLPGALAGGFNPNLNQMWKVATTAGGVVNYAADAFTCIDNFTAANGASGSLLVTNIGNDVYVAYQMAFVPEPPNAGTASPVSAVKWVGDSVTFTIVPTGTGPLTNQWRFNGTNLPGETGTTLTLTNLQLAQSGTYDCVVSSPYPPASTSSAAVLTVNRFVVNGYYRMGENGVGSNNRPLDSSGSGHDFSSDANGGNVLVSTTDPAPGSTNYYAFNGTGGFSGIGWDVPEDNVGVECWVRVADLTQTNKHVFGTGRLNLGSIGSGMNIGYDAATGLNAQIPQSGTSLTVGAPYLPGNTSEWVHVALVRASGQTTFYVNGVVSGASTSAGLMDSTTPYMAMGNGTGYFNGAIDEARIFTFAPGQFHQSDLGFYQGMATFSLIHPKPYFNPARTDSFYLQKKEFITYTGWWDLWYRYRGMLPFGNGVRVAQVEVYVPNVLGFPDKSIILDPTSAQPDAGGHADTVGKIYYGSPYYLDANATFEYGFSRGVTNIASYTSGAFDTDVLQIPSYEAPNGNLPAWNSGQRDVLSISESMGSANEPNTIRALDYLIDVQNVLACTSHPGSYVGAYNGTLSGNVWNSLVVAQNGPRDANWNGAQSENVGSNFRVKPDLVTADFVGGRTGGASSWGTPTVASTAAFLLESARSTNITFAATNNYVLKSILMAGASKSGLVSPVWSGSSITAWDLNIPYTYSNNPPSQPLDRLFGAGLFNINSAYTVLTAGEQSLTATNQSIGWAWGTNLNSSATNVYWFAVTNARPEFVAMLVWNRHTQGTQGFSGFTYNWYLNNLKLELCNATNGLIVASYDTGNNVQQVYLPQGLGVGLYCLRVINAGTGYSTGGTPVATENYGLAWRTACPTAVPEAVAVLPQGNGSVKVVFQGVPVAPYKLFRCADLAAGVWTQVTGGTSDANGLVELIDNAPPAGGAFYRAQFTY